MRRRILRAMVLVTVLAVVLFAVPLGVAASRFYRSREIARLQREAARAVGSLPPTGLHGGDTIELPTAPTGVALAFYDTKAKLVAGRGPRTGGPEVAAALAGRPADGRDRGVLVATVPLHDEEVVVGAARASRSWDAVEDRIHRAWLAMGALGLIAVAIAAAIASAEARRLAAPVVALTSAADRLGHGDFAMRASRSGIAEVDEAGAALEATAVRLGDLVQRERAFAADASHQLSTPLTGVRYTIEAALLDPAADRQDALERALAEVERLEATVQTLLDINRDTPTPASVADIGEVIRALADEWVPRLAHDGRELRVEVPPDLPAAAANPSVVAQILGVLVQNAHVHGAGTVTVRARGPRDGVIVDIEDEGVGIDPAAGDVFERRSPSARGHGIGLSLARSLALAEGGRLLLQRAAPHPLFVLALRATTAVTRTRREPGGP